MTQYTTGTITLTNGSATVTGMGTVWLANLAPGALLTVSEDDPVAVVAAVTADGSLTLETPWPGASYTNTAYEAVRDFDPSTGAPLLSHGLRNTNVVVNRAILALGKQTATAVNAYVNVQAAQAAAATATTQAGIAATQATAAAGSAAAAQSTADSIDGLLVSMATAFTDSQTRYVTAIAFR
ncbi:hypothetical protein UAJ10_22885 [Nitrospirillum sp. BR 11164]|uniref:hypothetical protein n=1 Tax=Nitrospirillum sp. BR 11164 TaxID=3104324 RepID=UPI002AFEC9DE|nr:hypothetical protein [Nitrospirillum sp. BR 11164]MEA1651847.1 hypothetical protein [Nitrospirillum sp. BR 11164]